MRPNHKFFTAGDEGVALVASLWLSLILALLAVAIISITRKTVLENKVQMRIDKAWVQAEAGLAIASYHIADAKIPWRPRSEVYKTQIGGQEIEIYVYSPSAKIDLNGATSILLANLFRELGYDAELATKFGDRIADWRDTDSLTRLNGAEARAYLEAGLDYGPQNSAFENINQLQNVLGITANILTCVKPYLTIYAASGIVDPYFATGVVRKAAGLPEVTTSQYLSVRRSSLAGQVFEVQVLAPISKYSSARVTAIIRYTGSSTQPVWRHSLNRGIVPSENKEFQKLPKSCPATQGL